MMQLSSLRVGASAIAGRVSAVFGRRAYSAMVQEHFTNPRNVGILDKNDPNVGTAIVGKAACGDVIKLQIKVDPETDIIADVKFRAFGCGSAIASSSYATQEIMGMSVEEASHISNDKIANALNLPPVKIHCSLLAEDAIKLALKDWQAKQNAKDAAAPGA